MNYRRVKCGALILVLYLTINSCKKENFISEDISEKVQRSTCEQMKQLQNDQEFISNFKVLCQEAKVNNFETGFVLTKKKNEFFDYQKIVGEKNMASISFVLPNMIDGFIHAHYTDLYPNFSTSDIKAMYHVYRIGKMKSTEDFVLGLVTSTGSSYILKIKDPAFFKAFGETNFDNDIISEKFEKKYLAKVSAYSIYGRENSFELALLEMLEGSGLILFKGNAGFNIWMNVSAGERGKVALSLCM